MASTQMEIFVLFLFSKSILKKSVKIKNEDSSVNQWCDSKEKMHEPVVWVVCGVT